MARMPNIGSDHFPVLTTLQYEPEVMDEQPEPLPSIADHQEAKETIKEGIKEGEKLSEAQSDSPNDASKLLKGALES